MANARGKAMDNTHLSVDFALRRGFIHRDYIAHCMRWSHVSKYLRERKRYQTYQVLDVGCGKDLPLPRMLYSDRMTHTTGSYVGVDINELEVPEALVGKEGKFNLTLLGKTDFAEHAGERDELPESGFDLVTSFEVLEHVEPRKTYEILKGIWRCLVPGGVAFVSTPCYDPRVGAADNHVNEMSVEGLGALIEMADLRVDARWGTFASQRDYKHLLESRGVSRELWEELDAYYDSNVLACLLAPLFPDNARNCLWQLSPLSEGDKLVNNDVRIKQLVGDAAEHSSSGRWAEDIISVWTEIR